MYICFLKALRSPVKLPQNFILPILENPCSLLPFCVQPLPLMSRVCVGKWDTPLEAREQWSPKVTSGRSSGSLTGQSCVFVFIFIFFEQVRKLQRGNESASPRVTEEVSGRIGIWTTASRAGPGLLSDITPCRGLRFRPSAYMKWVLASLVVVWWMSPSEPDHEC